jgi:hypothetical protein
VGSEGAGGLLHQRPPGVVVGEDRRELHEEGPDGRELRLRARVSVVLASYVADGFDLGAIAVAAADAAANYAGLMLSGGVDPDEIEIAAEGLVCIYAGQMRIALARAAKHRAEEDGR